MTSRNSLERVVALLNIFSENRLEWTSDEMMSELGYSRPTLYRYLKTLREAGILASHPSGAFTLGPKVVEMDFLMRKSDALVRYAQVHLDALAAAYPGNSLLVRWYGNSMLCVASEGDAPGLQSSYPRGRPMPMARGAIARAIIAFLPRRRRVPIVEANLADLIDVGLGDSRDAVLETLLEVRKAGYAVAYGEVTPGVIGIAAPIFDGGTIPVATISMSLPRDAKIGGLPVTDFVDEIGAKVAEAAGLISKRLAEDRSATEKAVSPALRL